VSDVGAAGEAGAVGEPEHAGGHGGVEGDEPHNPVAVDVIPIQEAEKFGQDARRGGERLELVYVVVELVHRMTSWGWPETLSRTSPVARLSCMVRLAIPPTCSAWILRLCSLSSRQSASKLR